MSIASIKNEIIKNRRTYFHIVITVMALFIVYCIVKAMQYDILRNVYSAVNSILDIVGLVFLAVLFGFSFSKISAVDTSMALFRLLIVVVFLAVFFTALGDAVYGVPSSAHDFLLCTSFSYLFTALFYPALWVYLRQSFAKSKKVRIISILIYTITVIYLVLLIINIFTPIIFRITEYATYDFEFYDWFSTPASLITAIILVVAIFTEKIELRKKLAFTFCIIALTFTSILTIFCLIFNFGLYLAGIVNVCTILALDIIFFYLHVEQENELIRHEKELMQLQTEAMLDQIKPHFIYNSLSVIAALCEEDPALASKATTTFSDYLRNNLNFANKDKPIPFTEELEHIKIYVWLEQLRFSNKLKVEYDTKFTDFPVPALSIQTLVENSIRHGICKKKGTGTVRISSFENADSYVIVLADDGIGFDPVSINNDGKQHIGLSSASYRIKALTHGSIDIASYPEKGTTITIKIPKEIKKDENIRN